MVMFEQSKRLSEPLRWTLAGRIAVIAVGAVLVAALATVAVIASTSGVGKHTDCIDVTFASTLGAAGVHPCGARARTLCANPSENPALAAHNVLREACHKAALPYGQEAVAG